MNHRSAPVEVRERVAFSPCAGRDFLSRLKEEGLVSEAVLISTCNRTEIYAVVEDDGARGRILAALAGEKDMNPDALERDTYWHTDAAAVRHLYRVASSLDSMIVGEGQILGQVRDAYRIATEEQVTGAILNRLFHTSLRVGKQVRSETGIGDSSVSVPHMAAKLAGEAFGGLKERKALILGAGEMSELAIKHLVARGVTEVRIANRTAERARLLAERIGGRAVDFGALENELREVDVVVSSTGSGEWVVKHDLVAGVIANREEPLFFIDIAVPRDVDPAVQNLGRVYVYDIDDLRSVVDHNARDRGEAAEKGEALIGPAVFEFMGWLSTLHVVPLIQDLRNEAERVRRHELSRTLNKLDLSPEETEAVERLSHSLVNKLLHGPIQDVKTRAEAGTPTQGGEVRRKLLEREGMGLKLRRSAHETSST